MDFGRKAVAQVGALLLLDWTVVLILMLAAIAVSSTGVELPQPIDDDWGPWTTFLIVVLLAPPFEELMFRTWLSGERRAIILGIAPWLLLAVLFNAQLLGPLEMQTILILSGCWLVSTIAMIALHWGDRSKSQRFRRRFPYAFWLTAGAFGLMHVFNYEEPAAIGAVLMIIPQFTGGLVLGYVRVRYGMWANIAQHVTHNAAALVLYDIFPDLPF